MRSEQNEPPGYGAHVARQITECVRSFVEMESLFAEPRLECEVISICEDQ
jgi:hypothetical protein